MMKLRNTEQRLEANRLRIAQSRLDITPEQQQQSSSPRSVRAYTKRKLERRLNRQPKRIVQYERLTFGYDSTTNYAVDVSVDFGTMNISCQYCDALRFHHETTRIMLFKLKSQTTRIATVTKTTKIIAVWPSN
ncbi:hypothetical protein EVAR_47010_1 [Eumeta japonica]|uniref:Uncharacterized protein n=1 Tax=Eumeta variegata TaxID=151549 RepID=A0A4C1XJ95_EUMVA|nr:hypothetical protein EVAR_47010_1 [Eumeta japonica]